MIGHGITADPGVCGPGLHAGAGARVHHQFGRGRGSRMLRGDYRPRTIPSLAASAYGRRMTWLRYQVAESSRSGQPGRKLRGQGRVS